MLLLPTDAGGAVVAAISAAVSKLGHGILSPGTVLAELGAFLVEPGALPQRIHADRTEAGFMSCQIALHDTPAASGGLALWPGSSNDTRWEEAGDLESAGLVPRLESEALPRGAVVCYAGQLWHRGDGYSAAGRPAAVRRVLYFTTAALAPHGGRVTTATLGDVALHPRLRCAPLLAAPTIDVWGLLEQNGSSSGDFVSQRQHCRPIRQ